MIELYGILQEQESINAELGLGVDYYKGEPGEQGIPGKDGKTPVKGVDYFTDAEITEIKDEIAEKVQVGAKGEDGKSAYQLAVEAGYEGSEADWLASLKGTDGRNGIDGINGVDGKDGINGVDGKTPVKGVDYFTTAEIQQIENEAAAKVDLSEYAKTADLSTVATSGSYNDLSDKPSIPEAYELPVASATVLGGVKVGSGLSITNGVLAATGGGTADSVDWSKIQNKPNFANVATSGDYNDLSNKPTIPSVEGLASEAYVNEKVAAIVIPEVPTKVSELENDKGYLTSHQDLTEYAKKTDIPAPYTLPTASTSTLGGVKVDGNTITIADGVISAKGGSGSTELDAYIKDASVSGNTLTLTKKDDTEVVFTPSGGSGGGSSYTLPAATQTTLGGIKVGIISGFSLDAGSPVFFDEREASVAYVPYAGTNLNYPGVVKVAKGDGLNYENGVISMSTATTTTYGTVAYDGKTIQAKLNPNDQPTLYAATATASSLGVIKPDGTTTTVDSQGNLSMIGKPAVIKTLITGRAPDWVVDWVANPDKYIVIVNNCVVFKTEKSDANFWYYWIDNDRIEHYYITFTDTTFTTPNSSQPSYSMAATQLITADNWQNYITAGGGSDWQYTNNQYNSDLYNVKEMVISVQDSNGNNQMGYFNFGESNLGSGYQGQAFYFDYNTSSPCIQYDGTYINLTNYSNLDFIAYKT